MYIKNIEVNNFKTFNRANIELGMFNVLIGSNASGKSNFLSVIKFIKDISEQGLSNAISMQGGIEYIRNLKISNKKNLSIAINFASSGMTGNIIRAFSKGMIIFRTKNIYYNIDLELFKRSKKYKTLNEKLIFEMDIFKSDGLGKKELINDDLDFKNQKAIKNLERFLPGIGTSGDFGIKIQGSLLESRISPIFLDINYLLRDISIYDIDPKLPKMAAPVAGKAILDTDGRNLAISLNNVLADAKSRRIFFSAIKDILPFIENVRVDSGERDLITNLEEVYYKGKFIPAYLISDGTINVTALILALYFGKQPILIEEPERNIHPSLLSKLISVMKDVSSRQEKQIVVTTHNPEIVRHAGIENILFARRDERGYSEIYKPSEREDIKKFLDNELGVDELFVQDLL